MRKFKCRPFHDDEVDLDDPQTYDYLPQNCNKLDDMMFKEIGQALVYMDYFHPTWFPETDTKKHQSGYQQRLRVLRLIDKWATERSDHYNDMLWIQEQIFLFQDETENMC